MLLPRCNAPEVAAPFPGSTSLPFFPQFVELMSRRQGELDALVATGYKSALTEERRRYCFLADRQCCVTKLLINYHSKVTGVTAAFGRPPSGSHAAAAVSRCGSFCPRSCRRGSSRAPSPPNCRSAP